MVTTKSFWVKIMMKLFRKNELLAISANIYLILKVKDKIYVNFIINTLSKSTSETLY
jgi:hypothetical protein